jgi:hypothetical protein
VLVTISGAGVAFLETFAQSNQILEFLHDVTPQKTCPDVSNTQNNTLKFSVLK